MSQIESGRICWPAATRFCGIVALVVLTSSLSGCAMKMPSFGFGKSSTTTSSLQNDRYAMKAPPAAYDRSPYIAPASSYQPAPARPRGPASDWVWSESNRGSKTVTVRRGESLYGIASRRRVAISELMAANRLPGPNVTPGQQLLVPLLPGENSYDTRRTTAARPARSTYASVAPNNFQRDGVPRVVSRYEQTATRRQRPRLFERSSETLDGRLIKSRSYNAARPIGGGSYRVRSGDTLYGIARRANINPNRLARHNRLTDPSHLRPGMTLNIPR